MRDIISNGFDNLEEQNRFPGAAHYVEVFDDDDTAEPADILSFEILREAFAALHSAETDLAETIPEIELSAEKKADLPEQPDYELENEPADSETYPFSLPQESETPAAIGVRLETIIEAMLFVGNRENRPLAAAQIAENLRNVSGDDVEQAVVRLNGHYEERNCPFTIITEQNGYRMTLRAEYESVRSNFYGKIRGVKLSQHAIDTLAVVAYRQPITAEEVQHVRNQSSSAILNQLVRRNLLAISRKVLDDKSVVHYNTTPRFLELFQIKSLDDIPKTDEWDYR